MRPSLGITLANDSLTRSLGLSGALVLDVQEGSSAERAGIHPTLRDFLGRIELGDVLVEADGKRVASALDFYRVLDAHNVGDRLRVGVARNGRTVTLSLTLAAGK